MGGPLKKGKAWIWGSYGKQNIKVGVLGFFKPEASCQALKSTAVALAASIDTINDCLNTDLTVLQTTNLKAEVQLFKGNKLSLFNSFAKKERNARGASDLNPIETTTPQGAVPKTFGKYLWNTGPTPTYKFADQYVISDRLLLDVAYTHVGNNFVLGFNKPELRDVQPPRQVQLSQRAAIHHQLTNRSATGGKEQVNFVTTFLADGNLFYYVTVVPAREATSYAGTFQRIAQSIRLNDQ